MYMNKEKKTFFFRILSSLTKIFCNSISIIGFEPYNHVEVLPLTNFLHFTFCVSVFLVSEQIICFSRFVYDLVRKFHLVKLVDASVWNSKNPIYFHTFKEFSGHFSNLKRNRFLHTDCLTYKFHKI